jgi:uncharacterized protein (TIGR02246 family)
MSTTEQNPGTNDEAEIRELMAQWAKAVREEDLSGIRAAHDRDILMYDVPPPLLSRGLDAYMATWQAFFAWSTRPVVFDFQNVELTVGSDVAFATAIGRCCGTERNGTTMQLEFRLTVGLHKRDGRWFSVHEHHSVPASD